MKNIIEEYSKKQLVNNLRTILTLEWFGIRIIDTKEEVDKFGFTTKTIYYYSVPESSTIDLDDMELNNIIKTSDGLKLFAKETLINMLIDSCKNAYPDDDEFIDEIKNNTSDYFKFYAKVRKGEVWSKEMGNNRLEELHKEIQKANGYKEV